MAKQASKMMIGGFLIIALFLLAASLVVFGSGKFFTKTQKFVLYFNEPVKGLDVGSPVLFQGVPVGSVKSIDIIADPSKLQADIPVIIQIELDRFKFRKPGEILNPQKDMPELIKKGFRGRLIIQSFISGKLLIELDYYPNSPLFSRISIRNILRFQPSPPPPQSWPGPWISWISRQYKRNWNRPWMVSVISLTTRTWPPASGISKRRCGDARKLVNRVDRQVDPLANDMKKTVKDIGNAGP